MKDRARHASGSPRVYKILIGFITLNASGQTGTIQTVAEGAKLALLCCLIDEVVFGGVAEDALAHIAGVVGE